MKPPMIPHQGRAIDTVNFRNVKDSAGSLDMGDASAPTTATSTHTNGAAGTKNSGANGVASVHGTPKSSGANHPLTQTDGNASRGSSGITKGGGGVGGKIGGGGALTLAKSKSKEKLLVSNSGLKGVPLDSGLATPMGERDIVDPFEEFNSVTLHHDGDGGER